VSPYQTFPDAKGSSDSAAKLAALRLPKLTGKSVLDVACNEGFFCMQAWRLGAARVVGIDRNARYLERARARDEQTEYLEMDWLRLGELTETFDVVLLLSALHYAQDPEALLRLAFERVSPDGMLLVECGLAPGARPEWHEVSRPRGDTVLHPTRSMMVKAAIPGAVARMLGPSTDQKGDPLPRVVFRYTRQKTIVLLVQGPSGSGKSTLMRALAAERRPVAVSLDHVLWTLPQWCEDPALLEARASREFRMNQIGMIGEAIAAAGLAGRLADAVLAHRRDVLGRRPVSVIEGHVLGCDGVAEAFAERLTARGAFVWHVTPSEARPALLGGTRSLRRDRPA
jgi:hypothetical protein